VDSRERTFRALAFDQPDRVPTDVWMSDGFRRKLATALGTSFDELLDDHDIDLRYVEGPRYVGPPLEAFRDGSTPDVWGVPRRPVTVRVGGGGETYREVTASPLAGATTVDQIEAYPRWPSPDWFDYSGIEAQCEAVRRQGRVAVLVGDRLNRIAQLKPAMYLRGVERIFIDMREEPALAHAIFGRIRAFYLAYEERILDAANGALDILLTGDDFGSQHGPLVSPTMWTEFLGDGFVRYARLAKEAGVRVMHHTCGSVQPIVPLLIARGLDILQSLQPEADGMDPARLKAAFGGRLAFHGGISIQRVLPFGTPDDVRAAVARAIEALAPGGGYILGTSHNIQADTPVENAMALLRAYRELGRY